MPGRFFEFLQENGDLVAEVRNGTSEAFELCFSDRYSLVDRSRDGLPGVERPAIWRQRWRTTTLSRSFPTRA